MKRYLAAALAVAIAALCQTPARAIDLNVVVLSSCGSVPATLPAGTGYSIFTDTNGNLCMNGAVTVTPSAPLQPVGGTPTDRTITSASGSSQQIAAANASRHSLTILNTGNANCGVNPTGGTAAIGGAGTITLSPLGSYTPRIPSLSAVNIICASGQPIYGDES